MNEQHLRDSAEDEFATFNYFQESILESILWKTFYSTNHWTI